MCPSHSLGLHGASVLLAKGAGEPQLGSLHRRHSQQSIAGDRCWNFFSSLLLVYFAARLPEARSTSSGDDDASCCESLEQMRAICSLNVFAYPADMYKKQRGHPGVGRRSTGTENPLC